MFATIKVHMMMYRLGPGIRIPSEPAIPLSRAAVTGHLKMLHDAPKAGLTKLRRGARDRSGWPVWAVLSNFFTT
jgi:hypothetical protein